MSKKVLIITYYWPPSAGGGVQRWLKFAKYLSEYGWAPIIYTPENPDFDLKDDSLLTDVSGELTVVKNRIWEPYGLLRIFPSKKGKSSNIGQVSNKGFKKKVMSWVRGNLLIPDPRKFWVKPSIKFLLDYLKEHDIDTIVTTGPPHSMHLIGLGIKKRMDVKWLVDIRDPWSGFDMLDNFLVTKSNRKKYVNLEKDVLKSCDGVIATSPSMKHLLQEFDHRKFASITNGYDRNDFSSYQDKAAQDKIVIYHAGLINDLRNPENFIAALDQISMEKVLSRLLQLHLVGIIETSVKVSISDTTLLKDQVLIEAYKKHSEVLSDYGKAHVLLLLVNNTDNAAVNIPGKTFEYLATGKPIICISDPDTDVAKILSAYDHCLILPYTLPAAEVKSLLSTFLRDLPQSTAADTLRHSRKQLTADLDKVLRNL